MSEQLLVSLTEQNSSREMCSPIRRHIKKMKNTSAFDIWSSSGVRRGIKIKNKKKEEGRKEEDIQEVEAKQFLT